MQNRIGPNRVGPNGILQPLADLIKMILKEDIVRLGADRWVFNLAPAVVMFPAVAMWAVIPFTATWIVADLSIGILFVIAITGVGIVGIFMAGWSSDNKFSLLGAMRSVALLISYEVPMILAVVAVVLVAGSMSLRDLVTAQGIPYVFAQPMAFVIFLLAAAAELNRTPFDLMEAESEIVAGFHTEYTGMKFGIFYVSEWAAALAWSAIIVTLFLSGWRVPFLPTDPSPLLAAPLWLFKTMLVFGVFIWFRATWPRLRIDQILGFSWKVLFPLSVINLLVTAIEVLALEGLFGAEATGPLPTPALVVMAVINTAIFVMSAVALSALLRPRERELAQYPVLLGG
jgi:NADH-quinone oxidoreductase subunit H